MITPRAPRDGDLSRTAVLPSACRAIGARLAAARDTRQLSIEAVASELLLSRGQVLGLERANPAPFYTPSYFLRGLRKYMAFMEVPLELLVDDEDEQAEDGLRLTLADLRPASRHSPFASRAWTGTAATAALVVASLAGASLIRDGWSGPSGEVADTVTLASVSPLPAQPIHGSMLVSQAVHAEPASAGASGDADSSVRVSVGKPTWVFVRYLDNRVIERRLAAGEELEVGPLPVFLAVGTADSVEVLVENRPVALGPYIRNGQVRMTKPDLARLVP
jgi:transcriptional regulator with XRE-family HTH domain